MIQTPCFNRGAPGSDPDRLSGAEVNARGMGGRGSEMMNLGEVRVKVPSQATVAAWGPIVPPLGFETEAVCDAFAPVEGLGPG